MGAECRWVKCSISCSKLHVRTYTWPLDRPLECKCSTPLAKRLIDYKSMDHEPTTAAGRDAAGSIIISNIVWRKRLFSGWGWGVERMVDRLPPPLSDTNAAPFSGHFQSQLRGQRRRMHGVGENCSINLFYSHFHVSNQLQLLLIRPPPPSPGRSGPFEREKSKATPGPPRPFSSWAGPEDRFSATGPPENWVRGGQCSVPVDCKLSEINTLIGVELEFSALPWQGVRGRALERSLMLIVGCSIIGMQFI